MLESKNIANPDDKRSFEHGEVSLVNLTGFTVGRADLRPGWRWSTDVKPLAGTDTCPGTHRSYVVSGRCCASLRMSVVASLTMSTPNRIFRAREWPTALMVAAGCSW